MSVVDISEAAAAVWDPPAAARGSLAVIAGGGESTRVYERFGRRISADGYRLAVFEASESAEAGRWLAAQEATPRVLVGSDVGATIAARLLAGQDVTADGAILAGIRIGDPDVVTDVSARTACPLHLGVLGEAAARARRAAEPVDPPAPDALAAIAVPVLAVHGGGDPIVPFGSAADYLARIPRLELLETVGGLHDALNDASHRSVAAQIVLWLERLRTGASIVRPVTAPAV